MGGSGGGSYLRAGDIEALRDEAKQRLEKSRNDAEINTFLQQQLVNINNRDADKVTQYLEHIEGALQDQTEAIDRLLFGGSVAKHTYVDGLSDIDSLVILKDPTAKDRSPAEIRNEFMEALRGKLPQGDVAGMRVGNMAVTIEYRDGTEIQLLPAVQSGGEIHISSPDGRSWIQIHPQEFARTLTEANQNQGGTVVPVIKLAKAILFAKLGDKSPSGYHVECLAVSAFKEYTGSRTPKAMLTHFFDYAASDVLKPIRDVTGQSRHVDGDLGGPGSPDRSEMSHALEQIAWTMAHGREVSEWRRLME